MNKQEAKAEADKIKKEIEERIITATLQRDRLELRFKDYINQY